MQARLVLLVTRAILVPSGHKDLKDLKGALVQPDNLVLLVHLDHLVVLV